MGLGNGIADVVRFECNSCLHDQSARRLRRSQGICSKCGGRSWTMATEYLEGQQSTGILPLLLYLLLGIRVLNRDAERIRIVTPSVPAQDAAAIAKSRFRKFGRTAFAYMERRRESDGERDRQRMQERGGKNCVVCGMLFMPSMDKPWTASGCCTKVCLARSPTASEPQFIPDAADTDSEPKPSRTVSVLCGCGHQFNVPAIYSGTLRPCPLCDRKVRVS